MTPALLLALVILAPGAGLMPVELRRAPVGWQDADGFHHQHPTLALTPVTD